jgi:O-antigen/teichoic acid export membrane protein
MTGTPSGAGSESLVARNFLTLGSGEALARLIAFAAIVYVARTLGPESYGIIELAAAIVLYFSRIADFGVDLGLGVREIAARRDQLRELAPVVLTARLLISALLVIIVSAIGLIALPLEEGRVLAVYSLTLLAVGAGTRWIHIGLEKTAFASLARIAGELLMVGLVFAFVRSSADLIRVPLAKLAGDFLAALILAWLLSRWGIRLRPRLRWSLLKPLVPRAWPLVVSALLGLMIYNSDLIFIRIFTGRSASVGYYAAAYTLVSFLANLGIAYSLSLLPTLTRLGPEPKRQLSLFETAHAHVFAVGFPIAIGVSMLAGDIIALVFGQAYEPAVLALRIVVWSVPLGLLRDIPIVGLMASQREDRVLRLTAWATASNVLLNVALIPPYGIYGAAVASVLTEGLRMVLAFQSAGTVGWPRPRATRFWRSTIAGAAMAAGLQLLSPGSLPVMIGAGAAVYFAALAMLGGIRFRKGRLPALSV